MKSSPPRSGRSRRLGRRRRLRRCITVHDGSPGHRDRRRSGSALRGPRRSAGRGRCPCPLGPPPAPVRRSTPNTSSNTRSGPHGTAPVVPPQWRRGGKGGGHFDATDRSHARSLGCSGPDAPVANGVGWQAAPPSRSRLTRPCPEPVRKRVRHRRRAAPLHVRQLREEVFQAGECGEVPEGDNTGPPPRGADGPRVSSGRRPAGGELMLTRTRFWLVEARDRLPHSAPAAGLLQRVRDFGPHRLFGHSSMS